MKYLITSLLFLASFTANAAIIYKHSGDTLQKLYAELHYLREAGLEIHKKYTDSSDPYKMKACDSEYGYITTRAKATIGIANRLDSPNKQEYIDTGWQAYECIRCSGNPDSCDKIPPTLKTIETEFRQLKTQHEKHDSDD